MSSETIMWLIALVAVLSLAVAGLAVLTFHRARLERRRSEARVAALASAIDNPGWRAHVDDMEPQEHPTPSPLVSLVVPETERPSRTPAFAIAAVVIVGAGSLLFVGMKGGGQPPRQTAPAPAIELMSMRHVLDGETLIVSGLVRNPALSATPALSAVISVLGRDGLVVARGESQLVPVVLEPGKETTFRVSVPEVGDPGRYRVAFVNGSQIVPHLDRRSDLARTALANDAHGN